MKRHARARLVAVMAAVALALPACSTLVDGNPNASGGGSVPNAQLNVAGDSGSHFDTQVKNALVDVIDFWKQEYPKVSGGKPLPQIKGGFFSVDGAKVVQTKKLDGPVSKEACLKRDPTGIVDNAFYCLLDDSIAWDRSPQHLVPALAARYGDFLTAMVLAHEFGHALQANSRLAVDPNNDVPTIYTESQADCAAGAFTAAALKGKIPHFPVTPGELDRALNGYFQVRDSTPESPQDMSHGNGFDRLAAIADGIKNGPAFCYDASYMKNRTFTERPYVTDEDYLAGGNMPLQEILKPDSLFVQDLNRFWTNAAGLINKKWTDVKIAQADHPKCGADKDSQFGYCPDDNTVYYSTDLAKRAYYSLDEIKYAKNGDVSIAGSQPADFALGTLFAIGWGMAVRHQLFDRGTTGTDALLAGICYTGAYAKDINVQNDPTGEKLIVLSPPDMDEASSAVMNLVGKSQAYGTRSTTGLQRIQAFVKGYDGSLSAC
jgi:predicted metalloprotease